MRFEFLLDRRNFGNAAGYPGGMECLVKMRGMLPDCDVRESA